MKTKEEKPKNEYAVPFTPYAPGGDMGVMLPIIKTKEQILKEVTGLSAIIPHPTLNDLQSIIININTVYEAMQKYAEAYHAHLSDEWISVKH